jgi:hypothetical protein
MIVSCPFSAPGCRRGHLASHVSRSRRVIDDDAAGRNTGEDAIVAEYDRADIVVIADAGKHDVRAGGGKRRRRGAVAAMFITPALGLFRRAVIDRDLVPGLHQVPGHRVAHDAQAYECNAHISPPLPIRQRRTLIARPPANQFRVVARCTRPHSYSAGFQAASSCAGLCRSPRGSSPTERAIISRIISELPA